MPRLDFQFMRSVVHLCPTCHFHMHHIAIANERRGNGASIDFFVGDPGSRLTLQDAYRLRLACTATSMYGHMVPVLSGQSASIQRDAWTAGPFAAWWLLL